MLQWMPEQVRQQKLEALKGFRAVKFPAAYFFKTPQSMHLAWVTLSSMDSEGLVIKTGPEFLIKGLIKTMEKYEQPYQVIVIGDQDEKE